MDFSLATLKIEEKRSDTYMDAARAEIDALVASVENAELALA